jgi:hypothetical protein
VRIQLAHFRSRAALLAVTSAVAIMGNTASVAAYHDLYRRVSAGGSTIAGNGAFSVDFAGASTDGKRVFFTSAEQLTTNDDDSQSDVFMRFSGVTTLQSVGEINGNGPFGATFAGASADGSRVFFQTSEQLLSTDTDSVIDVYQRSASVTTRVSTGATTGNGNAPAVFRGMSSDGTRVFFTTDEQLVSADTDHSQDIYERSGGTTTLTSAGQINGNGALDPAFVGASADGVRVWFSTAEKLVPTDTDSQSDVYQRSGGQTFLISRGAINGSGNFAALFRGASSDGSRVFFSTSEQLVSADTDSQQDIYEFSPGGVITLISAAAMNGNGPQAAAFVHASTDGTRVLFETTGKLVSADTDSSIDIYQRSAGVTSLISIGAINGNGAMNAGFRGASADGMQVFFVTTEKLVTADTDAQLDVYQRFLNLNVTHRISEGPINDNGAFTAQFLGASADGSRVFFATSEQLVDSDDDAFTDIYEHTFGAGTGTYVVSIGDGAFAATFRRCSADGLAVFFTTAEKVLPTDKDAVTDIYGAYDVDV